MLLQISSPPPPNVTVGGRLKKGYLLFNNWKGSIHDHSMMKTYKSYCSMSKYNSKSQPVYCQASAYLVQPKKTGTLPNLLFLKQNSIDWLQTLIIQSEVLMYISFLAFPKLISDMTLTSPTLHHPLVDHQTFQSHRTTRMDLTRTDPNLSAEPIPKPIGKPRGAVDIDRRAIDRPTEHRRLRLRLCDDRVRMVWGVLVDVIDSSVDGIDGPDRKRKREPFGSKVFILCQRAICPEEGMGGDGVGALECVKTRLI